MSVNPQNAIQPVIESDNVGDSSPDAHGGYYTDLSLPDTQRKEKEQESVTFNGRENLQLWTSKLSWGCKDSRTKVTAAPETYTDASDIDQSYSERNQVFQQTPATPTSPIVDSLFTEPNPKDFPMAQQQPDFLRSEQVWLTSPVDNMWKLRSSSKGIIAKAMLYDDIHKELVSYLVRTPGAIFVASAEDNLFMDFQRKVAALDSGFSDAYFNSMDISPEDRVKESPTVQREQMDPVKYKNDTSTMRSWFEQGLHETVNRPETSRPITPYAAGSNQRKRPA